jgi:predicted amidohydrolase
MNELRPFRLAMIQMRVDPGDSATNLKRAEGHITRAAAAGAQVLLLPEALNLGWTHSSARDAAEPIPGGEGVARLSDCAQRHRVYVCAGLIERAGQHTYNAAVLIDPDGRVALHHRKIYELEVAHASYSLGACLQVASTQFGTFGLMICADAFAPGQVLSRSLALMGAAVILSPCAWAVPENHDNTREPYGQLWRDNYAPVARDYQLWIAGVSNVGPITTGPWAGRNCIGCSLLVGPQGEQVVMGPYGSNAEAILYAEIHPVARPARGDGWERLRTDR